MGQIVGAFATSHVLGAPDGVEDQSEVVFQGMRQIGMRLRAARPVVDPEGAIPDGDLLCELCAASLPRS